MTEVKVDCADIERLYRSAADGIPREELLQQIYDMAGPACELRPPVLEVRLARLCGTERNRNG